jgi:hypothetical protein
MQIHPDVTSLLQALDVTSLSQPLDVTSLSQPLRAAFACTLLSAGGD